MDGCKGWAPRHCGSLRVSFINLVDDHHLLFRVKGYPYNVFMTSFSSDVQRSPPGAVTCVRVRVRSILTQELYDTAVPILRR